MKFLQLILYSLMAANIYMCELNGLLLKEYFRKKFVSFATIFTCNSIKENFQLAKELMGSGLRINLYDIKKNNNFLCERVLLRNYYQLGAILYSQCNNSKEILFQCGKIKLLDEVHHWLLIFEKTPNMEDYFENITLNINADINVAVPNRNSNGEILNWTIFDVYNPASEHGGSLKVNYIGFFKEGIGYQARLSGNKYWIRRNLTGVTFKSAVVIPKESRNITLEEYLTSESNRETNSMHRFQSATVRHCKDLYNFSLIMQRTDSWGYIQRGTTFNGLVGLLQRKLVDFGSSPLIYKYDRMPVVDYSFGNWILKSTFIFRPPALSASSFEIFVRPLERKVWWCMITSSILTAVVLKIILRTERVIFRNLRHSIEETWGFVVIFILGCFCQQGNVYSPILASGKILTLFFLVLTFLIYQFYSGYIVSYLLMDPPREINSLEDLLHSSLDVGIENILIDRDYFKQTSDPIALELFHEKVQKPNSDGFYDPSDGVEMVLKQQFAFHVETSTAYPLIQKTFPPRVACELEEVQMYRTQPMHSNLQKHSPFKEMLNYCMLRLFENGEMVRLRNYWDSHKPECIAADFTTSISVDLNAFSCALLILTFGICLSLSILLVENVSNKRPIIKFIRIVRRIMQIKM